jgi:hypothetical protein
MLDHPAWSFELALAEPAFKKYTFLDQVLEAPTCQSAITLLYLSKV